MMTASSGKTGVRYYSGEYNPDIYLLTLGTPETCPRANFTANYLVDPPGGLVTFTDASSSGTTPIAYRLWNFSDGSSWENDPAPVTTHSHTFSQDGVYTVKMTAGNAKCRNISIAVPGHTIFVNSSPIADFTATPLEGLSPLTVTFTDRSYGAPTSLTWDFGDGSPVTNGSSVIHMFTEIGKEYNVTLTATNGHGSSTAIKNIRTLMGVIVRLRHLSMALLLIPGTKGSSLPIMPQCCHHLFLQSLHPLSQPIRLPVRVAEYHLCNC